MAVTGGNLEKDLKELKLLRIRVKELESEIKFIKNNYVLVPKDKA